jgi:hypothetical protein
MQIEEIAQILSQREAGQVFTVEMIRPGKVRKGTAQDIQKHSVFQGQHCDYANRSPVREAIEAGVRGEPELPGHIAYSFQENGVRFWQGKNSEVYLPVVVFDSHKKSTWYSNGVEVPKSDIAMYLLASETSKPKDNTDKGQVPFVGINIKHILDIR